MKKLANILALALGLSLLAVALGTITSSPAPASSGAAPVNIAAVTVPSVPVSGTVTVGNTASVNVANTPSVTLAAGSNVSVGNLTDAQNNPNPLVTLDASQPYEDECTVDFTQASGCFFQAVPATKRLVIQEVDTQIIVATGSKPLSVVLNATGIAHYFTATLMGTNGVGTQDFFSSHQETRLYVPQNTPPLCVVNLNSTSSTGGFTCNLSGFLVDVP